MKIVRSLALFFLLLAALPVFSQHRFNTDSIIKHTPTGNIYVHDYTNTLTPDQEQALESKLADLDQRTSTQVAVAIIDTLNGNDIADYNVKLFRTWGVGTKKNNNGVLLLISKYDHLLNIATGYGLEGALPDITCKEIIDETIVPKFKGEDYYRGIDAGIDAIIQAVQGVYTSPVSDNSGHKYPLLVRILFWIIGIIVLIILIATGWIWPLLNIALSIAFSSGGSSSGGGGGSFGGGSGGGGGASGSW